MLPSLPEEHTIGIDHFISNHDGVGGSLRNSPEDFQVYEIENVDYKPLSADSSTYQYLIFRATLLNWDTNSFTRELSSHLNIPLNHISWAGTKDKRALTTQLFSLKHIHPISIPPIPGVTIQPVGRLGRNLYFGDLVGNHFEITVHDPVTVTDLHAISDDLKNFGNGVLSFPNYFGHQRFGSIRPITHHVGLCIARGDWEGALMSYLGNPHPSEPEKTQEARSLAQSTHDWELSLSLFPNWLHYERNMLKSLIHTGGVAESDYRMALETLPRNLQLLLIHAAQSYIFNRILSLRMDLKIPFHLATVGDAICFSEFVHGVNLPNVNKLQIATSKNLNSLNRHLLRNRAFITAPLIGSKTPLSQGSPGEIEQMVLSEVGLSPSSFDLPGLFNSFGSLRPILTTTDLKLQKNPLKFSFDLPRGSYATVFLREYLKSPLSQM